jgi:O-antigen/teichoic acid export membrane protein
MVASVAPNTTIKRNIVFNVVGGSWAILLNLLATRVIIRQLGPEAYGLASFGTSLQVLFALFDLGFSITVIREVAQDTSENHHKSHSLVQTALSIYWLVAGSIGLALVITAPWIVRHWFTFETLDLKVATTAFRGLCLATAFNWPIALYVSSLTGLQRMDVVNGVRVISVTSYLGGGIVLLYLVPDLTVYMIWNALTSLMALGLYATATHRMLPGLSMRPRISWPVLQHIWQFASQLYLISLLSMLFTQTDRFLIGKILIATQLGFYNTAVTIITGVAAIQTFISSALMPAMAADVGRGDVAVLHKHYYKLTQILVYLVTLPVFVSIFYGRDLLSLWTTTETAAGAYRALGLLAFGSLINAALSPCYNLFVATGNVGYPLRVNLIAVIPYVAILFALVTSFGIVGAALAWLLLNIYYLVTFMPITQKRILGDPPSKWFLEGLVPYLTTALISFAVGQLIVRLLQWPGTIQVWSICALSSLVYIVIGYRLLDLTIRQDLRRMFWNTLERLAGRNG